MIIHFFIFYFLTLTLCFLSCKISIFAFSKKSFYYMLRIITFCGLFLCKWNFFQSFNNLKQFKRCCRRSKHENMLKMCLKKKIIIFLVICWKCILIEHKWKSCLTLSFVQCKRTYKSTCIVSDVCVSWHKT